MKSIAHHAKQLLNDTLDSEICLAITGLSRSGKTAFIASLVHQLLYAKQSEQLPLLSVCAEKRLIGVKRVPQSILTVPPFAYEAAMANLYAKPAVWPESTRGVSEVNLEIKFHRKSGVTRFLKETSKLKVQVIDYPGEWLLDLPMLNQSFLEWSSQLMPILEKHKDRQEYKVWQTGLAECDLFAAADESHLAKIAEAYTALLLSIKADGFHFIQPGRFVLPAELAGAPILQFFPITLSLQSQSDVSKSIDWQSPPKGSNLDLLYQRFDAYCNQIVKRFYQDYFSRFDRQIVLIDCLQPLNQGMDVFNDLQQSLTQIMKSFQYGQRSLLRRLFSPCIDKLLFAATKSDHITSEQQPRLLNLLQLLVRDAQANISFQQIEIAHRVISSIRVTEQGIIEEKGMKIPVIRGRSLHTYEPVTYFPGDVPHTLPDPTFWQTQGFDFINFAPAERQPYDFLPHIRMDSTLEFLLGDKLR